MTKIGQKSGKYQIFKFEKSLKKLKLCINRLKSGFEKLNKNSKIKKKI